MIAALAVGLLLGATPAPDVTWVLDGELAPRAAAARTQADAADKSAASEDAERAQVVAQLAKDQAEQSSDQAGLATMSHAQRKAAEARLAELATAIPNETKRRDELVAEAAANRAKAASLRAFADAATREDAARRKQAADALEPDSDVHELSDAKLGAAKAWANAELARMPKQQAALDQQQAALDDVGARAAVAAKMDALRARGEELQQVIGLVDDELRYRADEKRDQLQQAANMTAIASARAADSDTPTPKPSVGPDGKDDQDRFLDRVLAQQDADAAASVRRRQAWTTGLRYGALALILAGGLGAMWWVLKKGAKS